VFGHNQTSLGLTLNDFGSGSFTYMNVAASFTFLNDATVYIDDTPTAEVPEPASLVTIYSINGVSSSALRGWQ
jgi:hypothetical protein